MFDYFSPDHGVSLGKSSERLVVRKSGKLVEEIALFDIRSITVQHRGVSLSSDLIMLCAEHGIDIVFLDNLETPVASLYSTQIAGNLSTLRAQFHAVDTRQGAQLSSRLIAEQIRGRVRLLRYVARRSNDSADFKHLTDQMLELRERVLSLSARPRPEFFAELMGLEGAATRNYWAALRDTVEPGLFGQREGRGAEDTVNRSLNYGYAVLSNRIWAMCVRAGLDPRAGLMHRDRPGRHSLVQDLIEPWRVLVDDAVFGLCRRRKVEAEVVPSGWMNLVVDEVLNRLEAQVMYRGESVRVATAMQRSVREVAAFLRGEGKLQVYRWDVRGPKAPEADPFAEVFG